MIAPICLLLGVFALAGTARADTYTIVPDAFIYCTTCHGVELQGNRAVAAPRLNGMEAWYVRSQLHAFRRGWRGRHEQDLAGMEMAPQAAVLDEQAVTAASEFVASIPARPKAENTIEGSRTRGEQLYLACAVCHGASGEGNATLDAPGLAGQNDWYLAQALHNYQLGIRGGASDDHLGARMRAASMTLTDATAINDVVAYINSLADKQAIRN